MIKFWWPKQFFLSDNKSPGIKNAAISSTLFKYKKYLTNQKWLPLKILDSPLPAINIRIFNHNINDLKTFKCESHVEIFSLLFTFVFTIYCPPYCKFQFFMKYKILSEVNAQKHAFVNWMTAGKSCITRSPLCSKKKENSSRREVQKKIFRFSKLPENALWVRTKDTKTRFATFENTKKIIVIITNYACLLISTQKWKKKYPTQRNYARLYCVVQSQQRIKSKVCFNAISLRYIWHIYAL